MFNNTFPCLALLIFVLRVFIPGWDKLPSHFGKGNWSERTTYRCLCHNSEMTYSFTVVTTHISLVIFTHHFLFVSTQAQLGLSMHLFLPSLFSFFLSSTITVGLSSLVLARFL